MKRIAWIVGTVIAVLVLLLIALPFVVDVNSFRPKIETELSSALGRKVKIGNLKLSLLSGSVTADNLSISDDPAFSRSSFVRAKALHVGVEVLPLVFSKTLHVTNLTLDQPEIVLLRSTSGRWNFSSLGANAPKQEHTKSDSSFAQNLSVNRLNVKNGQIAIGKANAPGKNTKYQNVNISVRNFSFSSSFPFTLSADLPGGGSLKLDGTAGPINPDDAAATPLQAQINVKSLNVAATGFVEPSSGIGGLADFEGTLKSDGHQAQSSGTLTANKLKLSPKGSPADVPVVVKYAVEHNLQTQTGRLTRGDVSIGKALAQLTGGFQIQGDSTPLNMKLAAQSMPVDDLEAMLPALGVILPSGSSLKGGTLSTNLAISGPVDKLVITGPIHLADTKLAGFNLGSKLSAISALSGAKTGSDTVIQNFSTDAHATPGGIETQNVNLNIPTLGVVTGSGTISPDGALDYKMSASFSGTSVGGITQLVGMGSKGGSIPFFIRGTTSNPSFVPDVKGMLSNEFKLPGAGNGQTPQNNVVNSISGLFGKKKK